MQLASAFLALLICGSAMVIPIIRRRVVRVLVLGVCGFSVTGMYLIYAAPDLALTQIMFEIISVVMLIAMVGFVSTVAYCRFILRGDIIE